MEISTTQKRLIAAIILFCVAYAFKQTQSKYEKQWDICRDQKGHFWGDGQCYDEAIKQTLYPLTQYDSDNHREFYIEQCNIIKSIRTKYGIPNNASIESVDNMFEQLQYEKAAEIEKLNGPRTTYFFLMIITFIVALCCIPYVGKILLLILIIGNLADAFSNLFKGRK